MDAAKPRSQDAAPHTTADLQRHALVALALAALTALAFLAVARALLPAGLLEPVILILAAAQITLQVLYYMHLRWYTGTASLFFGGAVVLAVFISWSIWYLLIAR